ncbi:MAG: FKBP-type peptidyl-prolyl cis-trans isomerase [Prevotellaceae bacterium]|jgi:FKBP-type peptidyl-prolyl cis-trans isomerase|nr:FKBP-type peptidyl-prolyl cis-trans isomerase [Prevotellaceae bacterium]
MKIKILFIIAFLSASIFASGQDKIKDSVAYALGIQMAENLKQNQVLDLLDLDVLTSAVIDLRDGKARMNAQQCDSAVRTYFTRRYEDLKAKNEKAGKEFLQKNATTQGVVTLASGLQYKIENEGMGIKPTADDEVEVHYKGTLLDGRVFDSSIDRGQSAKFVLGRVIPGWIEGLQLIGEGGRITLYVPANLAYGDRGAPGTIIEPNATLIFNVELLKVNRKEKSPEAVEIKPN